MSQGIPNIVAKMAPATATKQGPVRQAAAVTNATAITGGEAPTEAEYNALVTKFNDLLAKLRAAGLIA